MFISKWGKVISKWGSYFKVGQNVFSKWGSYFKVGQLFQSGAQQMSVVTYLFFKKSFQAAYQSIIYLNYKSHQKIQFFKMLFVTLFSEMFASLSVLLLIFRQLLLKEFLQCSIPVVLLRLQCVSLAYWSSLQI